MEKKQTIKIGIISDTHGLLRSEVTEILKKCDYTDSNRSVDLQGYTEEYVMHYMTCISQQECRVNS